MSLPPPTPSLDPALQAAVDEHRAGRLRQAKQAYEEVLARWPHDPQVLLLFAQLLQQMGDVDLAAILERLLTVAPSYADGHYVLGQVYRACGRSPEAYACYKEALRLNPDHGAAHFSLGTLYYDREQWRDAVRSFREVIRLAPSNAEAHGNLGSALQECGAFDEAIGCFQEAIRLKPDYHEAHFNLGNAHKEMGQMGFAPGDARASLRGGPDSVHTHGNGGFGVERGSDITQAPGSSGDRSQPDAPYANTVRDFNPLPAALDRAISHYRVALSLKPDFAGAHLNLALALLLKGEFREGWDEYEWRWRSRSCRSQLRHVDRPQWRGEPIAGKTVVLYYEQGLGDTIQFSRFALILARLGARVLLEVEAPLYGVMQNSLRGIDVFLKDQALPAFDFQCPLLSVPRALSIDLTNIPAETPYLFAELEHIAQWRAQLGVKRGLRIGIVWAGSSTHRYDRNRSVEFKTFAPLFDVPDTAFFSLQTGPAAAQLEQSALRARVNDCAQQLDSFTDTAALVASLDLIITVDTAVAHLAAAMSTPTWMITPFAPDFRWLLEREDTPWYPTLRLFRQQRPDDWVHVIERIENELANLSKAWRITGEQN